MEQNKTKIQLKGCSKLLKHNKTIIVIKITNNKNNSKSTNLLPGGKVQRHAKMFNHVSLLNFVNITGFW